MSHRKTALLVSLMAAIGLAAAIGSAYLLYPRETPGILEASGQVRGTEVTVSSRRPGIAREVPIRDGELLHKGDLVARIAADELQARLAQAEAQAAATADRLQETDAQLKQAKIAIEQARMTAKVAENTTKHEVHRAREAVKRADAEVDAAQAQLNQDERSYERFAKLMADGFVSQNYFDEVRTRRAASRARTLAAQQAAAEAQAALERAHAAAGDVGIRRREVDRLLAERERLQASRAALENDVLTARARVDEVKAMLADTVLTAPTDGTVIAKLVEPGELVAAGRPIATLVDLRDLFVRVFIPERDIGRIRLGNPARIVADAFPNRTFAGRVVEIAQQAEFTPKDVHTTDERVKLVFGVKVALDNPEGYLKPGMPVDVRIKWQETARW